MKKKFKLERYNQILWAGIGLVIFGMSSASPEQTQTVQSIGAGPFEFPIGGTFEVIKGESGETIFYKPNGDAITVGFFRRSSSVTNEATTQVVAKTVKGSWEQHMASINATVVRPFRQKQLADGRHMFSMVSRVKSEGKLAYFIHYAVTDGSAIGTLFFTGFGNALQAASRFDPKIEEVR
jgi:hypothetical protein